MKMKLIAVLCLSWAMIPVTWAATALGEHTMAVAQSMSAFYMVSLSDGDTRYEKEFQNFANLAETHLAKIENKAVATELDNAWSRLRRNLKYDYMGGAGLTVASSVRTQYREYLSKSYRYWLQQLEQEPTSERQLEIVNIRAEVISARYFDVTSTIQTKQDPSGLTELNPTSEADALMVTLKQLEQVEGLPVDVKALQSVQKKWDFMQKALANYQERGAYFLLYYNKAQINKQLSGKS